jgi:hypothetical protein
MAVHWRNEKHRYVAIAGEVDIGAVFPPAGAGAHVKWRWRLWLADGPKGGFASGKEDAKERLLRAWLDLVERLRLQERA